MDITNIIATAAALLSGLSVFEFFKWLWSRKRIKRKDEAETKEAEYRVLEAHIKFCEDEMRAQAETYASQTKRLRETQDELFGTHRRINELEQDKAALEVELSKVRCNDLPCGWRVPPTAYTEPICSQSDEKGKSIATRRKTKKTSKTAKSDPSPYEGDSASEN